MQFTYTFLPLILRFGYDVIMDAMAADVPYTPGQGSRGRVILGHSGHDGRVFLPLQQFEQDWQNRFYPVQFSSVPGSGPVGSQKMAGEPDWIELRHFAPSLIATSVCLAIFPTVSTLEHQGVRWPVPSSFPHPGRRVSAFIVFHHQISIQGIPTRHVRYYPFFHTLHNDGQYSQLLHWQKSPGMEKPSYYTLPISSQLKSLNP